MLAPSLLAADFARLAEEVACIDAPAPHRGAGEAPDRGATDWQDGGAADWLHLDVMDGHFVPNISFGPAVVAALRRHTALPFDVHLMVAPVDAYVQAFAEAGADHITVHAEAGPHLHRTLQLIRAAGCRPGVALNPATPAAMAEPVLDVVDQVLVMTVNPGFGGQAFLPAQLEKVRALRAMIGRRPVLVSVDGGIDARTAPLAVEAGAGMLVAGTAVFGQADRRAALRELRAGKP